MSVGRLLSNQDCWDGRTSSLTSACSRNARALISNVTSIVADRVERENMLPWLIDAPAQYAPWIARYALSQMDIGSADRTGRLITNQAKNFPRPGAFAFELRRKLVVRQPFFR